MSSLGSCVFLPASEGQSEDGGGRRGIPEAARRKGLSNGRVMELVADLVGRRFYGKLTLHFEAGHIVCAKLEQTIKE
jgi:hypothetical protein